MKRLGKGPSGIIRIPSKCFILSCTRLHMLLLDGVYIDSPAGPRFRWYIPGKVLSHLSEKDLLALGDGGEHSCYPNIETVRAEKGGSEEENHSKEEISGESAQG